MLNNPLFLFHEWFIFTSPTVFLVVLFLLSFFSTLIVKYDGVFSQDFCLLFIFKLWLLFSAKQIFKNFIVLPYE